MTTEKKTIFIICIGISILTAVGCWLLTQDKQRLRAGQVSEAFSSVATKAAEVSVPPEKTALPQTDTESPTNDRPKVNLNTADKAELESLEGIGPAFAERIIEYRSQHPFKSIYDIKKVSGIGDKKFEKIKDFITVAD